jgi:non-lysosomal glucosylceramidase
VWEAGNKAGSPNDDPNEDMFSSLECFEYPGYGTSDVRFYGSWALAVNWPDIDKQEVKQFCDSVTTDRKDRPKALGTTAHDFGGDGKDVFVRWNTYQYRDSTQWKDLNSKLVLMAYRNYVLTGKTDKDLLTYCWPAIKMAMAKTKSQDSDKDGLPNSSGIDQTYDNMELKGNTAYCGTLYVAACEAAEEIAKVMGDTALAAEYKAQGDLGKGSLDKKLWNGKYYKIDDASDRIMSDQLAGQWYAKACGLPDIVPAANASSAFKVIYDNNFKKFDGGKHGIVNVLKADGSGDGSSEQTAEVWIGVVWGAVAGMIQEGLLTEASEVGQSMYNTIWDEGQFWFRTPEAWGSGLDHKRAWYYMRTNSVWAVKHAYDISKP